MDFKLYIANCDKCKSKTRHYIMRATRKRGVKLRCCSCGNQKPHYYNLNLLEEFKPEIKQEMKGGVL